MTQLLKQRKTQPCIWQTPESSSPAVPANAPLTSRGMRSYFQVVRFEDYITVTPGVRSGKPRIKGTRITVYDILGHLAGGMSQEAILRRLSEAPA